MEEATQNNIEPRLGVKVRQRANMVIEMNKKEEKEHQNKIEQYADVITCITIFVMFAVVIVFHLIYK